MALAQIGVSAMLYPLVRCPIVIHFEQLHACTFSPAQIIHLPVVTFQKVTYIQSPMWCITKMLISFLVFAKLHIYDRKYYRELSYYKIS